MNYTTIPGNNIKVSRIGLGTWAIGGWILDGYDESRSIQTVVAAFDKGINIIDTSPIYGLGRSEEIVGKAIREYGERKNIVITTKAGLEWEDGKVARHSSPKQIIHEIDRSLMRLGTDYIDIYLLQAYENERSIVEAARIMKDLFNAGKIRAIGVSNFSLRQMDEFRTEAPLHVSQSSYNLFERAIEDDIIPYCCKYKITLITHGSLCRGLLTGKTRLSTTLVSDHFWKTYPKSELPRFLLYQKAIDELNDFAESKYRRKLLHLAMRWILDTPGIAIALWGARKPEHMAPVDEVMDWQLDDNARKQIDAILKETISDLAGHEYSTVLQEMP